MSDKKNIYDSLNEADRLYNEWNSVALDIYELRLKLDHLQQKFNEALKNSVDMTFTSKQIATALDFNKFYGFSHPKVKEFLKLVLGKLLPQDRLSKTEWAKDLQLIWMNGSYSSSDNDMLETDSSYFTLQFVNKQVGLGFTVECPVKENTHCKMQDPDLNAGKYVIRVIQTIPLCDFEAQVDESSKYSFGNTKLEKPVLVARLSNSDFVFDVIDKIMTRKLDEQLNDVAYIQLPRVFSYDATSERNKSEIRFSQDIKSITADDVRKFNTSQQDDLLERYQYFIGDISGGHQWRTIPYTWETGSAEFSISHVIEDIDLLKEKAEDGRKQ